MRTKILIVDDEQEWLDILQLFFSRKGWLVTTARSGEEGWACISETVYDLVICDLAMPDISGIELLTRARAGDGTLPFIIMTGVGSIETAVEAVQMGAYSYITKPFRTQDLELLVNRASEHGKMHRRLEATHLREEQHAMPMILGTHAKMLEVLATINKVADSTAPVLIWGESGTGKSLLASHIHNASARSQHLFLTIDCGALPETLLESELFGHVKGAFTGAHAARRGLLEEAQGGTVFLDEIGELSSATQVKLLRAIQEREIRPVGGNKPICVDVRFITATNKVLTTEVEAGRFREDLYYRLAVIPIELPPLRDRMNDFVTFVGHFVQKFNSRYHKNISGVSPAALRLLMEQPWKGNIRELENVLERAVLLAEGVEITPDTLGLRHSGSVRRDYSSHVPVSLQDAVRSAEQRTIAQALALTDGNRTKAASLLGIGRRTLYDKLEEYGLA